MAHSATTVQMGNVTSSFKKVTNHRGSIAAGLCVRLKSDDTITTAEADGASIGISLGKSQSDIDYTPIVREGARVPVLLTNGFTPVIGAQVKIDATTGKASTGGTGMNATYVSSTLTAIGEDGVAIADGCALIDMPGGL